MNAEFERPLCVNGNHEEVRMSSKRYLTAREAVAEGYFSSVTHARDLRASKRGPPYIPGRPVLYDREDLDAWMTSRRMLTIDSPQVVERLRASGSFSARSRRAQLKREESKRDEERSGSQPEDLDLGLTPHLRGGTA